MYSELHLSKCSWLGNCLIADNFVLGLYILNTTYTLLLLFRNQFLILVTPTLRFEIMLQVCITCLETKSHLTDQVTDCYIYTPPPRPRPHCANQLSLHWTTLLTLHHPHIKPNYYKVP